MTQSTTITAPQHSPLVPVTGVALSAWACYLMNGDMDGMTDMDLDHADAFAVWLGGPIVSCDAYGFSWSHDAVRYGALAGDCSTYTALVREAELIA